MTPSKASSTWTSTAAAGTLLGVTTRIAQRLLALTAAIWHNRATAQPITRSLIAYDH